MKTCWIMAGWAVLAGLLLTKLHAQVSEGDCKATVVMALGEPSGEIDLPGNVQLLMFDRGNVRLEEGQVISYKLMPEAALLKQQQQREARLHQWQARQEELQEVKQTHLENNAFAQLPPAQRITQLQKLHREYPDLDLSIEYHAAVKEQQAELDRQWLRQREAHNRQIAAQAATASSSRPYMRVGTYSPAYYCPYRDYTSTVKAHYGRDGFSIALTPRSLSQAFHQPSFCPPTQRIVIINTP